MSSGISPDLITIFMLVIITVLILIGIVLNKAHANRQANCLESIEMHLDVLEEDIICTDYSESTGEDFIGTSEENEYNRKDTKRDVLRAEDENTWHSRETILLLSRLAAL